MSNKRNNENMILYFFLFIGCFMLLIAIVLMLSNCLEIGAVLMVITFPIFFVCGLYAVAKDKTKKTFYDDESRENVEKVHKKHEDNARIIQERLSDYNELYEAGYITKSEFEKKQKEINSNNIEIDT